MTTTNVAVQWFVVHAKTNFDAQASQRLAAQYDLKKLRGFADGVAVTRAEESQRERVSV